MKAIALAIAKVLANQSITTLLGYKCVLSDLLGNTVSCNRQSTALEATPKEDISDTDTHQ